MRAAEKMIEEKRRLGFMDENENSAENI